MALVIDEIPMRVGWRRKIDWDFSLFDEIRNQGEVITGTPTLTKSATDAELTIQLPVAVSNTRVQAWVHALAAGTFETICEITTDGGSVLNVRGSIVVEAKPTGT